jgi:hypothetical protein
VRDDETEGGFELRRVSRVRETYPLGERRIIHSEERKEGKKGKMYTEEMDTHKSGQEELRRIEWTGREEINHDGNAKPDQINNSTNCLQLDVD